MTLTDAADELYGMDPATFVARRTELVKLARSSGDKELASQIGALRRPTVSAWYLNLLARSGTPELDDLIELGETMREAQSRLDMARVTSLGQQRQHRESAVLRRLDLLLAARGIISSPSVWAEVGRTLTAVAADAAAAAAVRSGCLTRGLVYAGFGDVDLSGAVGAELEAWVDQRAAQRADADERAASSQWVTSPPTPSTAGNPTSPSTEPSTRPLTPASTSTDQSRRERLLTEARTRLGAAVDERREAEREVEALGLAYAAAQERLQAAAAAEAQAQSAVDSLGDDARDACDGA